MRAFIVGFGNGYFGCPIQIAIVRLLRMIGFLNGVDAMLFQHSDQELGIDQRPGVEEFHWESKPASVSFRNSVISSADVRVRVRLPG